MKKYLLYLTAFIFLLTSTILISFIVIKKDKDLFISKFEKICLGTRATKLYTVFGEPHIFYGADVSIIFSNLTNNSDNEFKVYRFSQSNFFIPIVCDFLIKNDVVYEKKLTQ